MRVATDASDDADAALGLAKDRRCTDVPCLLLFVAAWILFVVVTLMGAQEGDVRRLYRPRDYKGDYCGVGSSLGGHDFQIQMMNLSHVVDYAAEQLVCSSASKAALEAMTLPAGELDTYLCACCHAPCASCDGSLDIVDLATPSQVASTISGRMGELTNPSSAKSLFLTSSSNAAAFSAEDIWKSLSLFFVPVCVSGNCAVPNTTDPAADARSHVYQPAPDKGWRKAWDRLANSSGIPQYYQGIQDTIGSEFTFRALPSSRCPYDARYCVPFPGVKFLEAPGDVCAPALLGDVAASVGSAAAEALEGLGAGSLAAETSETFGTTVGALWRTIDALAIVTVWALMVSIIFMVLVRFTVGIILWAALLSVPVLLSAGGGVALLRSHQCAGSGFLDIGKASAVAISIGAEAALTGGAGNEALTGSGADYRGHQMHSRSGRKCQRWDAQSPHSHTWTAQNYPAAGLAENYCRNPDGNASTIWCLTNDASMVWELCSPIGVLQTECVRGYEVSSEGARQAMQICAYIVFALAGIFLLSLCCVMDRIFLAIRIHQAAAMFIYHQPTILLLPIAQVSVGIAWCFLWFFCAAFLLSQVPEDYSPSEFYATYAEAYGTADQPGACTDKWPTGFVWKYQGDLSSADDPCSGALGNTTGMVPRCWRCGLPRYAFDVRFAYSFFSFLWGNAFLIALGQCIIAGACAAWFFTPRDKKGMMPGDSILRSVKNTFRYHTGSLAFGSLVLAVVQFIGYVLMFMEKQAKAQKNRVMALVLRALQCCTWCVEKCLKFLNKNAYIQVAILGKPFCTSAKRAFLLIARNIVRFGCVALLGAMVHWIGCVFIIVLTMFIGYFILQALHPEANPVAPMLAFLAVSYLVSKLFLNVFHLAVDTFLQCFITAEEQKVTRDFVPKPLMGLFPPASAAPAPAGKLFSAHGKDTE